MAKRKCPKCGSLRLYREVSVVARLNINTDKVYNIEKDTFDGCYDIVYCERCGWNTGDEKDRNIRLSFGDYSSEP